jgi:HK97 family phage portal protein
LNAEQAGASFRGWLDSRQPATEQRSLSFQQIFGQGLDISSAQSSTMQGALTLIPVFACARYIAHLIASCPIEQFRMVGDQRIPMPLAMLFQDPSIFSGPFEWVERQLLALLLRGNTNGLITQFDYTGYPRQIEWLQPDEATLMNDFSTQVLLYFNGRIDWRVLGVHHDLWRPQGSQGDLVHIPWLVLPGFIKGVSPIGFWRTTIEAGQLAQSYGRDWFKSGAQPKGILAMAQPTDQSQAEQIKAKFKTASAGGDIAVVGAGATYQQISVPADDAQFLNTIRATATQIAVAYGLPTGRLGGGEGSERRVYANVEDESQDLVNALIPYAAKLEGHLSNLLPRGQFVKFDLDSLIRANQAARFAAYQIALGGQMGAGKAFMTVDEIRQREGLEPIADEELEQQQVQQIYQGAPNVLQLPEQTQPQQGGVSADGTAGQ